MDRHVRRSARHMAVAAAVVLTASACGSDGDPGSASTSDTQSSVAPSTAPGLSLVVIGDSIPYNSPDDCPGCAGFVDRYADAVESAIGEPVDVQNLSQHTGLTLPDLLTGLDGLSDALADADVILVAIAHNSAELNADEPCGTPLDLNELPVWSEMDQECAVASAAEYRPQFESLFSQVAALRGTQPTILRTVNRYNDWIGWPEVTLGPDENGSTKLILDAWNAMICEVAEANGFGCADIYSAFNGPDGLEPAGDLLAADYTHPSEAGNELIAEILVEMGFAPLG